MITSQRFPFFVVKIFLKHFSYDRLVLIIMTFKFLSDGWTKSSKILMAVFGSLFVVSVLATLGTGAVIAGFGLSSVPAWVSMVPYAGFMGIVLLALAVTIVVIITDMIIHKNYNEYVDLLKIVPKEEKYDENLLAYVFDDNC